MHMADALVSAPVAITTGAVATILIATASSKVAKIRRDDLIPLMGVMGAFVFAAQMINFSIPGTGSSGHIIGGVLLAALLGPWAAFITLASVLIIQCLVFADGGLMALGCNLINMGALSCLIAYPFIFRPIFGKSRSKIRIMTASIVACVIGLELGALCVTAETELSGVTELPTGTFLMFMLPIHLAIGLVEGIATGAVLLFINAYKPGLLYSQYNTSTPGEFSYPRDVSNKDRESLTKKKADRTKRVLAFFGILALFFAVGFTWIASANPDGLEWSIQKITGDTELGAASIPATALMPDYNSTLSGIVGGLLVIVTLWGVCAILFRRRNSKEHRHG